jgi:hemerythrin-like domain-containing protein
MAQLEARTLIPFGGAIHRAQRAVTRALEGFETYIELETEARPVLAMLLRDRALERALLFLERDGDRASVAIMPRRSSGPPTVTELFEEDHSRLDCLATALCEEAKARRPRAFVLAPLFVDGLRRHIQMEEEILFPLFEMAAGASCRNETILMRREHVAIERYLVDLLRAVERLRTEPGRTAPVDDLLRAYWGSAAVLADHNAKEERRLFPIVDRALSTADREELLRRVILF